MHLIVRLWEAIADQVIHYTGAEDQASFWYGLWSGFVPSIAILVMAGGVWKHVNCHVDGCPRIGTHHVPGTTFKTCRRHHPTGGNTAEAIAAAHEAAQHR